MKLRAQVNADIVAGQSLENLVRVGKAALPDAVYPHKEAVAECGSSGFSGTDEIGDRRRPGAQANMASQLIRRACTIRPATKKSRSLLMFARTSSLLK